MIDTIKQFFEKNIKPSPDTVNQVSEHSLQLATAALLIEMMRADSEISNEEKEKITEIIRSKFNLDEDEISTLVKLAEEEIWNSTGYYEFTSLINKTFTPEQKIKIVEHLWEVAFSDKSLDKHEEYMVRKISDLIYVQHKDFIDSKLKVKKKISPE